jgi:ABC-type phosphate/phosphonate transport system substrate-binding protein
MTKKQLLAIMLIASFLTGGAARATGKEMLLCLPGFPGSQAQAQPYVDKMLRYLEQKLEWPALSATGVYLPDGEVGVSQLETKKPMIALVGPSIYVSQHKKLGMKVIAKIEASGRGQETYSVVTRTDGPSKLKELIGKKVTGAVVHDEKYVLNVLLDKKNKKGQLVLESQKRPLRALKAVVRGKADAAIVDQSVIDNLSDFEQKDEIRVIYTSKPVPSPLVVVMGEAKKNAEKLKEVLIGMCAQPDGVDLCKSLTISSIKPASNKSYKKLLRRYNR